VPLRSPQHKKDLESVGAVMDEAAQVIRGLEHPCYEDRLRELGLFRLEKAAG